MKVGIIVQARMSSQRFPGKVLHTLAGKQLLQYLIERLSHCRSPHQIVVATSTDSSDSPVADFCRNLGVTCYRGPLLNVAGRFKEVVDEYGFDVFVRVNGDSPLLDQRLIEKGISIFLTSDSDLVTNVLPRSYPVGQSVEVLRSDTFRRTYPLMQEKADLEHVTRFFHRNQERFKVFNSSLPLNYAGIRLSVDTQEDLINLSKIIRRMSKPHWQYDVLEILQLYEQMALDEKQS